LGCTPITWHAFSHSALRILAASSNPLPRIPRSPRVRYNTVTECPSSAYRDKVPAQPDSGSSGWPPTQTIFNRRAASAADAVKGGECTANSNGAASTLAFARKFRRGKAFSAMDHPKQFLSQKTMLNSACSGTHEQRSLTVSRPYRRLLIL